MRTLLIVDAVSFGVFGLAFIFLPDFCARLTTGTAPGTPAALTDVRAIYGGMALDLASFFWLAAAGTAEIGRLGLRVSALAFGFIALARSIGIALDGSGTPLMYGFLTLETLAAVLSVLVLRRTGRTVLEA